MNKLEQYRVKSPTIAQGLYDVKIKGDKAKIEENTKIPVTEKNIQIMNKVSNKSHRPDRNPDGTQKKR